MVVETDDREERVAETAETPTGDSALIGWLSAIHSEVRAQRVEMREIRRELVERIESVGHRVGRLEERVGRLEERMARVEAGLEAERERKNRLIMWVGIGIGALVGAGGVAVGVIGLLN